MFFLTAFCAFIFQFIFSTALDGKIKAWLYDNLGSRVDYDAPGRWCTTMAYSVDGTRLTLRTYFYLALSITWNAWADCKVLVCFLYLVGWVVYLGCSHVGPAKMVNPIL